MLAGGGCRTGLTAGPTNGPHAGSSIGRDTANAIVRQARRGVLAKHVIDRSLLLVGIRVGAVRPRLPVLIDLRFARLFGLGRGLDRRLDLRGADRAFMVHKPNGAARQRHSEKSIEREFADQWIGEEPEQ